MGKWRIVFKGGITDPIEDLTDEGMAAFMMENATKIGTFEVLLSVPKKREKSGSQLDKEKEEFKLTMTDEQRQRVKDGIQIFEYSGAHGWYLRWVKKDSDRINSNQINVKQREQDIKDGLKKTILTLDNFIAEEFMELFGTKYTIEEIKGQLKYVTFINKG